MWFSSCDVKGDVVLLCPINLTDLNVFIQYADFLDECSSVTPVFLLSSRSVVDGYNRLSGRRLPTIVVHPYDWPNKKKSAFRKFVFRVARGLIYRGFFLPLLLVGFSSRFYRCIGLFKDDITDILEKYRPKSILIPNDNSISDGFLMSLNKVCGELGIKRIIFPFSYLPFPDNKVNKECRRTKNKLPNKVVTRFPTSVWRVNKYGERVSYYTAMQMYVLQHFGMLQNDPWVIGKGASDVMLVEGKSERERFVSYGCNPEKLKIVGNASHDDLYDVYLKRDYIRRNILKKYGLEKDKKTVIISFPRAIEEKYASWSKFLDIIVFICSEVLKMKVNTLVSLHPSALNIENYKFIEDDLGGRIIKEPLKDVLPIADIYIATFSSTVEWAVLCNIPVILYDFFDFQYDKLYGMYEGYKGVKIVDDYNSLSGVLFDIVNDDFLYNNLVREQLEKASLISPFDGRCKERILDEITN